MAKPRQIHYQGETYSLHGFHKKFCEPLGMSITLTRSRFSHGKSPEEVIRPIPHSNTKIYKYEGKEYTLRQLYNMKKDDNMKYPAFRHLVNKYGVDVALGKVEVKDPYGLGTYHQGSVYKKPEGESFWFIPNLMFKPTNHNLDYQGY